MFKASLTPSLTPSLTQRLAAVLFIHRNQQQAWDQLSSSVSHLESQHPTFLFFSVVNTASPHHTKAKHTLGTQLCH